MIVLMGDIVRTSSGKKGEIVEIRGVARTFIRILHDGVKSPPMFASEVVEIVKRPVKRK